MNLSIHIRQSVLQVYTNPSLLTTIEQHEEGDFVTGRWSDYFPQINTCFRDSTRQIGITIAYYIPAQKLCSGDLNIVTLHYIVYKRKILLLEAGVTRYVFY